MRYTVLPLVSLSYQGDVRDTKEATSRFHRRSSFLYTLQFLLYINNINISIVAHEIDVVLEEITKFIIDLEKNKVCLPLQINDVSQQTGYKEYPAPAEGEDGVVRAIRDTDRLTEEVMIATGCPVSYHSLNRQYIFSSAVRRTFLLFFIYFS